MHIDNGSAAVRLVIKGLFDGLSKVVGNQIAFVAQVSRPQAGPYSGKIDGEPVRLMVAHAPGQESARPPMMIATILPEER